MSKMRASLLDGSSVEYYGDAVGEGAEKVCHFTTDGQSVVLFYKDARDACDPERMQRLQSILGKYNPTANPKDGAYWKQHFCWPTAIVSQPTLGIVTPLYPNNFFFPKASGPFSGKEKTGRWFCVPKVRQLLPEKERGNWLGYLKIGIVMARAVARLHSAGLAHSDLSAKNVLVDPVNGTSIVIDIDTLVVPGIHPPKVLGTRGYIAPEVVAGKALPSIRTDLHALPVLIYEYLLLRHPLMGPKVHSTASTEEDDRLSMGESALFVEHPKDRSNRPKSIRVPCEALGPYISEMFHRAFVDGLHSPDDRPTAIEWERALVRSTDLLLPCSSRSCEAKWFIFTGQAKPACPFCGSPYGTSIPILNLYSERRAGQFTYEKHRLALWHNWVLHGWHIFDNVWPGGDVDKTPKGYCSFHKGKWVLVNQSEESMVVLNGSPVPSGSAVELRDGMQIRLSAAPHGRLAVVQMAGG